jgi:uncharacterized membrane protein
MTAAFFAILSSICFGTGDFFGGVAAKQADLLFIMIVNQIAGLVTILLAASLLSPFHLSGSDLMFSILAGVSTTIGVPLLYKGLAIAPMSIVAPVTALIAILLPVVYGMVVLGETPGYLTIAGFALGGFAVFLLGGGDRIIEVFKPAAGTSTTALRGLAYALAAGLCIATFYVAMKRCSPGSGLWPLVAARSVAITAIGGLVGLRHRSRPLRPPEGRLVTFILLSGTLDSIANAFYLIAAHGGDLGVVSTITSLYPATTILLARYILGERISLPQAIGVGSALVAIVTIISNLQVTG